MMQSAAPLRAAVWFEIPVAELERGMAFYGGVLQAPLRIEKSGPNAIAVFAASDPVQSGHLYQGKPASTGVGPTVHLAVSDTIEAALERVIEAGGKVVSPIITIPAGRFAYCEDPDGNSFGLFA